MNDIKNRFNAVKGYHKNPRYISQEGLGDLRLWLKQFGDLGVLTVDINTWEIVSGNQRNKIINLNQCELENLDIFEDISDAGTVGWAYVIHEGERFQVRFVQWSKEQVEQAVIIANKSGGFWNMDKLLDEFDNDMLLSSGWDESELIGIFDLDDDNDDDDPSDNAKDPEDSEPINSIVFYFDSESDMSEALLGLEQKLDDEGYNYTRQIVKK